MVEGGKVAVIGAGMAGLTTADILRTNGFEVEVFEKARGPGGRMATRREDTFQFDIGAPYFTVWDSSFREEVRKWEDIGIVEPWEGRIGIWERGAFSEPMTNPTRYVGTPRMSSITRYLSDGLTVIFDRRIVSLRREEGKWHLSDNGENVHGPYDILVLTPPAPQIKTLLEPTLPELAAKFDLAMYPCWSVMVAFRSSLGLEYDGLLFNNSPLSWAARDSSKPGREGKDNWVLHGSRDWSTANLDRPKEEVANTLLRAFFDSISDKERTSYLSAHRWRHAIVPRTIKVESLFQKDIGLGVAGDWMFGSRIEGAFLSGKRLSESILRSLSDKA